MRYLEVGGLTLGELESFSNFPEISHFITTRRGGFSSGYYRGLNLGFDSQDEPEKVRQNRELLAQTLNLPAENWIFCWQIGGDKIVRVKPDLPHRNSLPGDPFYGVDALLTDTPGLVLAIQVADCVPVFFYDPAKKVIAMAHCGWRGTVKRLAQKTLQEMTRIFGCLPADVWAGVGPAAGPECYQVGPEVIEIVENQLGPGLINRRTQDGKGYFDLWQANYRQLTESGVLPRRIEVAGVCPHCRNDLFFSVRAGLNPTGRFACGLTLRGDNANLI